MDQKETLAKLLRQLAGTVEHSTATDLEALVSGRAGLVISNGSSRSVKRNSAIPRRSTIDLAEIAAQLRDLSSREAGLSLMEKMRLTKKDLEELARLMDLPVLREDDAERLRQKIVEDSIGSRLNSQAIRGR